MLAFHALFMAGKSVNPHLELSGEGHWRSFLMFVNDTKETQHAKGSKDSKDSGPGGDPLLREHPVYLESEEAIWRSNEVDVDLRYDKHWFPDNWQREALATDPDLLVFAHARLAFCRQFGPSGPRELEHLRRTLPPPSVCIRSLGPLVDGTAEQQRAWAKHLLLTHWAGEANLVHPPLEAVLASLAGEDLTRITTSTSMDNPLSHPSPQAPHRFGFCARQHQSC